MGACASVPPNAKGGRRPAKKPIAAPPEVQQPRKPTRSRSGRRRDVGRSIETSNRVIAKKSQLAPLYGPKTAFSPVGNPHRGGSPPRSPGTAGPAKVYTHELRPTRGGRGTDSNTRAQRTPWQTPNPYPPQFTDCANWCQQQPQQADLPANPGPMAPATQSFRCTPLALPTGPPVAFNPSAPLLPPQGQADAPYGGARLAWGNDTAPVAPPAGCFEVRGMPLNPPAMAGPTEMLYPQRQSPYLGNGVANPPNEAFQPSMSFAGGNYIQQGWLPPCPEYRDTRMSGAFSNGSSFRSSNSLPSLGFAGTGGSASAICGVPTSGASSAEMPGLWPVGSQRVLRRSAISFKQTVSVAGDNGEYKEALVRRNSKVAKRRKHVK